MISIVVCTYHPTQSIFEPVLDSLLKLSTDSNLDEIVIVDNASPEKVKDKDYVKNFLNRCNCKVRVVLEERKGLTFARIRGVQETTSKRILFVDDDNILSNDYIEKLAEGINKYPFVACWGPGDVSVKFDGEVDPWVDHFKGLFQEKHYKTFRYGCLPGWHGFSPAGTGLSVSRDVLEEYIKRIDSGELTAADRTGKALTSGGDSQIIHVATLMDKAVGQNPNMTLTHFIAADKATLEYMKNLLFMVNQSIHVHYEVFPELKNQLLHIPSRGAFLSLLWRSYKRAKFNKKSYLFIMPVVHELGLVYGSYKILGIDKIPFLFRKAKKWARLK